MSEFREVNGQHLVLIEAYRLGDDYLLTKSPGYQWHVCHVKGNGEGTELILSLVDTWYEITDAVQGALAHRQSRIDNIVNGAAQSECDHEWVSGLSIIHPEDLEGLAPMIKERGIKIYCHLCDEVYKVN